MSLFNEMSVSHIKIVAQIDKREEIYDYRCLIQPTQICMSIFTQCGIAQFLARGKKKKGIGKTITPSPQKPPPLQFPHGNQKVKLIKQVKCNYLLRTARGADLHCTL